MLFFSGKEDMGPEASLKESGALEIFLAQVEMAEVTDCGGSVGIPREVILQQIDAGRGISLGAIGLSEHEDDIVVPGIEPVRLIQLGEGFIILAETPKFPGLNEVVLGLGRTDLS